MTTCHEEVTRKGKQLELCDKPAVALRRDPENGRPYPVCAFHVRTQGMVLLDDVRSAERVEPYEGGLPVHFPIGVTAEDQGPTEPDEPHHRNCWCGDPQCYWALALAAERDAGQHSRR